jgi:hypothetical protein
MANKQRPTTVIGWASEHWFLTGVFIVPALIALPVGIIRAVRGPSAAELDAKRREAEADLRLAQGRVGL